MVTMICYSIPVFIMPDIYKDFQDSILSIKPETDLWGLLRIPVMRQKQHSTVPQLYGLFIFHGLYWIITASSDSGMVT